jgi:N-acetylglutamate synthase-like GNAT family acetyltransferase
MQKEGKAFGRVYWYTDDITTIYLDCLSVNKEERKKGIGTLLQIVREEIGRMFNNQFSCLSVLKNSWMYNWYIKRGYTEFKEDEEDTKFIWMRKILIQN